MSTTFNKKYEKHIKKYFKKSHNKYGRTIKNIVITYDGKTYKKNRLQSLSISTNGLLYLSWKDGRIYFNVFDKPKKNQRIKITPLHHNDKNKSIQFKYVGDWEGKASGKFKIIQVDYVFKITFMRNIDYNVVKRILSGPRI